MKKLSELNLPENRSDSETRSDLYKEHLSIVYMKTAGQVSYRRGLLILYPGSMVKEGISSEHARAACCLHLVSHRTRLCGKGASNSKS